MDVYARIPEHDIYVFKHPLGGVACSLCNFGDLLESVFRAESTQEMVDHVKAHERKGDRVPEHIYDNLRADDPFNYPEQFKPKFRY